MADEEKEKAVEQKEKWYQSVSSVVIGVIFILIGLPLWWHTTKVYRAPLPYQDIEMLTNLKLYYKIPITVIITDQEDVPQISAIKESLVNQLNGLDVDSFVVARFEVTVREATPEEQTVLQETTSIKDLDSAFESLWRPGESGNTADKYRFIFLPTAVFSELKDVYIGRFLHSFIPYNKDINSEVEKIATVIRNVYINSNPAKSTSSKRTHHKNDIENIRAQKSVSGYQISFTLLNADPKSVLPQWDIKNAVAKYLTPFLQHFPNIDTSIDSQVVHYSSLQIKPRKKNGIFYLRHQDLPHLINPIEAKLGSYVSLNSSLNFIVYVPTQKQTPLFILDKHGKMSKSNAFLSPQWGGIMIYNVNKTSSDSQSVEVHVDMAEVMRVFISQLKLLLGVKPVVLPDGYIIGDYTSTGVTSWEQVSLLRDKTIEYLTTSTSTLTSLASLLEQISNMVIGDQIQKQIQQALLAIHKSKEAFEVGEITTAFREAKTAIISSEKAFFDPSILALLYFPDDQKYAIYIPLFLPISFPVVVSLIAGIKWLKSGGQTKDNKHNKATSGKKND